MAALNILPPERITRVTESIPKIISFIEVLLGSLQVQIQVLHCQKYCSRFEREHIIHLTPSLPKGILKRGHAYTTPTGVYFDTVAFGRYGKLHHHHQAPATGIDSIFLIAASELGMRVYTVCNRCSVAQYNVQCAFCTSVHLYVCGYTT